MDKNGFQDRLSHIAGLKYCRMQYFDLHLASICFYVLFCIALRGRLRQVLLSLHELLFIYICVIIRLVIKIIIDSLLACLPE